MRRTIALYALGLLALFILYRFGGPNPPPPEPLRQLDVTYIGCAEVMKGDRCLMTETATLTFWMPEHECATAWRGRSRVDEARCEDTDDGMRISFRVAARKEMVTLRMSGAEPWSMEVEPFQWPEVIQDAQAARKKRDFVEAIRLASTASTANDVMVRAAALGVLARARHATGDERWQATFEESIATAEVGGWVSGELEDRTAYSYALRHELSFSGARTVLAKIEVAQFGETSYLLPYFVGLIEFDAGNVIGAVEEFERSLSWSRRLNLPVRGWFALNPVVVALSTLGRRDEATAWLGYLDRAADSEQRPCVRALLSNNAGWYRFQLANKSEFEMAHERLQAAADLYSTACDDKSRLPNILHSLAYSHLVLGQLESAEVVSNTMAAIESSPPRHAIQSELLRATIDLRRERFAAARNGFLRSRDRTSIDLWPNLHWESLCGLAKVAEQAGDIERAIRYYRAAEQTIVELSRSTHLGGGRLSVLDSKTDSIDGLVRLLLRSGKARGALDALRRRRRQMLESLGRFAGAANLRGERQKRWEVLIQQFQSARDQQTAAARSLWTLPKNERKRREIAIEARRRHIRSLVDSALELVGGSQSSEWRQPADQEMIVLLHRTEASIVIFVSTAEGGVSAHSVRSTNEAVQLLTRLRGERLIRLLITPRHPQDVRALSSLSETGSVEYSMDLPRSGLGVSENGILLVGDPTGDLPASRAELATVAAIHRRRGANVTILVGDEASYANVRRELESGQYVTFHYAGHASFAGIDGIDSGLSLSAGTFLAVTDVLTLRRVPARVILSGCESSSSRTTTASALGIGQAFLLAGAQWVIGSDEPVPDGWSGATMGLLYELLEVHDMTTANAVTAAQRRVSAGGNPPTLAYWAYSR